MGSGTQYAGSDREHGGAHGATVSDSSAGTTGGVRVRAASQGRIAALVMPEVFEKQNVKSLLPAASMVFTGFYFALLRSSMVFTGFSLALLRS
jgi:hypothetical protein